MQASPTQQQTRWQEIQTIWKDNRWLYLVAGIMLGILSVPAIQQITGDLNALIGNLVPESIGIIFTVLFLERAANNRAQEAIKQQLLAELNSPSTAPAVNALERLRREGMLDDDYFVGRNLECANWEGAYIGGLDFEGANLRYTNLKQVTNYDGTEHQEVNLTGTNLELANLTGADLVQANLKEAALVDVNLTDAHLRGANLTGADLTGANLTGANLLLANLKESALVGANFTGTDLWSANLTDANLVEANLTGAELSEANLTDTNLVEANLTGADLTGANLTGADLTGANLTDAHLTGANLTGANLVEANLEDAKLPDNGIWTPDEDMGRFTNPDHPEYPATLEKINEARIMIGSVPIE